MPASAKLLRPALRCASLISGPPFLVPCHAHSPCLRMSHFQGSTKKNMNPNLDTFRLGFGLGTTSVFSKVVLGNRYGSVGTTEIENRIFGFFFRFFFWPFTRWQRRIRLLSRLNLLGVTQSVFFMLPKQTQTSTSSTAAGITSGTECAGGDGPSSAVLGSAGQASTDSNTVSVVSTVTGTHVVHGWNTVTAE